MTVAGALRSWVRAGPVTATYLGTLVATHVVLAALAAIDAGVYPASVLSAVDVGVSYGAQGAAAAASVLLPWRAALPCALVVAGWPLLDADWTGWWPDFTSVGHLVAAGIGFGVGLAVRRGARSAGRGPL